MSGFHLKVFLVIFEFVVSKHGGKVYIVFYLKASSRSDSRKRLSGGRKQMGTRRAWRTWMTRSLRRSWVRCSSSNLSRQTLASMVFCDHVTRQTCARGSRTSPISPISWISQGENKEAQILQCSTYRNVQKQKQLKQTTLSG